MFSAENKSETNSLDSEIFVFHPDEILGKNDLKNRRIKVKNIFKNIDFKKIVRDIDRLIPAKIKNKYRISPQYSDCVKEMWQEFKGKIISGSTALLVLAAVCLCTNALDFRLGYEVILDGETLALVTEEETVYNAVNAVAEDVRRFMGEAATYKKEPVFVRRLVSGKNLSNADEIKEHLLSHLDYMVECAGIYVSGEPVLALTTKEAADYVLTKHKTTLAGEFLTESAAADFVEKVDVKTGFMHIGMLKTPEEALTLLAGNDNQQSREYEVKASDTLWDIAASHGLSVERLLALNDGINEKIKEGDILTVEEAVPVLSVRTVDTEEYEESVPYTVEKIKDAGLYENTTAVAQKGVNGKNRIIAKITRVNGVETSREKLSAEELTAPVNQIEKVGTKKRPPTTGSGTFLKPTVGSLSSRYGSRWNRSHNGIDITGAHNTPIKAADGGVVTYSGWMDGYGNYIVINHENGYQTAYGHCSSLLKNVGDRVSKGDTIAKMGNTGRSTGTHLHFEVKKNGVFQNPLEYVNY